MNDTLAKLKQAVAETSITAVANKIGVSRTAISLIVADKYGADVKKVLAKFEAAYGGVNCPYLAIDLTREQCRSYASKARPSNPLGLAHWKACQNCIHRTPEPKGD